MNCCVFCFLNYFQLVGVWCINDVINPWPPNAPYKMRWVIVVRMKFFSTWTYWYLVTTTINYISVSSSSRASRILFSKSKMTSQLLRISIISRSVPTCSVHSAIIAVRSYTACTNKECNAMCAKWTYTSDARKMFLTIVIISNDHRALTSIYIMLVGIFFKFMWINIFFFILWIW